MAKWAIARRAEDKSDNINYEAGAGKLILMRNHLEEYYNQVMELEKLS